MMKNVLLAFGLLVSTFLSQGQIKISDLKMTNLGDGRLYAEYATEKDKDKPVDGKVRIITGYTTEYMDAEFTKGIATGKWEYYADNKLTQVMNYAGGLLNGERIKYFQDGTTVKEKATFLKGKINGISTAYSPDGKLISEKGMKDGAEDGPERKYDEQTGELISDATYANGKQEGKFMQKINRGSSDAYTRTQYYKGGFYNGECLEVYENGTIKTKGNYINGKKDGLWESFKPDGTRKGNSETYKNGTVIKRVTYYTDGSVEYERNYNEQGKQDGPEKKYAYDGGALISEKNFVNGKQVGKQMRLITSNQGNYFEYSTYDENGKLVETRKEAVK